MRALVDVTDHATIVEKIVGQFALMKIEAIEEDPNFYDLVELDLNTVFEKADEYFVQFTTYNGVIDCKKVELTVKITEFLREWESVTDVKAIQQNVHYQLSRLG